MVGKVKYWKNKHFSIIHSQRISRSHQHKHYSLKTEFKLGHVQSLKIRRKIRRTLKKFFRNNNSPLLGIKRTMKTKKLIGLSKRGYKHTVKYKKFMSKIMKGKATKWLTGKPSNSKGHHLTEAHKNKLRHTIQKHHIDLNKRNNTKHNILMLSPKIHQYLHKWAYRYIIENNGFKNYYKWFKNKLKLRLKMDAL